MSENRLRSHRKGKMTKEDGTLLDGQKIVTFVFPSTSVAYHCPARRLGNRLYLLYVQGRHLHEDDFDHFLQSFRLTGTKKK